MEKGEVPVEEAWPKGEDVDVGKEGGRWLKGWLMQIWVMVMSRVWRQKKMVGVSFDKALATVK